MKCKIKGKIKRKMKASILGMAVFMGIAVFMGSTVNTMAFSEASVNYQVSTGKVSVHLEEYRIVDGKEVSWEDGQVVLPGAVLSKIPRIYNDGADCYVRTKVTFEGEKKGSSGLTSADLVGIGDGWVETGAYFYYSEVLKKGETVDLFQGIRIPAEWVSGVDDENRWKVDVVAEAIQSEFFKPDFTGKDPWHMGSGEYQILDAGEGEPKTVSGDNTPVLFEITQDMQGFSVDTQEFFREMETFIPGRTQSGILTISNETKMNRKVYIKSEILEENELLEEMSLTIQKKEKDSVEIIYQGPANAEKLQEYQCLGDILGNEKMNLEFLLTLPAGADNQYAAKQGKVKYTLTTDQEPSKAVKTPNGSTVAAKTGDGYVRQAVWPLIGITFSVLCVGGMYAGWHRRRKSEPGKKAKK
jgi:hypothetical protein